MKLITLFYLGISSFLFSSSLQLSFIAFDKETWKIIVCEDTQCQAIITEQEPRTYDYDFNTGNIVYIAADNTVHVVKDNNEVEILQHKTDAYTQPSFINDGKRIMLVQLTNKRSKKTKIISTDLEGKDKNILVSQGSTDLHPCSIDGENIYYTKTLCTEGCLGIKQEIWYKNIAMGNVKQLTLLNTISDQLSIDKEQSILYFTSLADSYYHIWQYNILDNTLKQLTFGAVMDSFPHAYEEGIVFLRRTDESTVLMKRTKNNKLEVLNIKTKYTKIRDIKVKNDKNNTISYRTS